MHKTNTFLQEILPGHFKILYTINSETKEQGNLASPCNLNYTKESKMYLFRGAHQMIDPFANAYTRRAQPATNLGWD